MTREQAIDAYRRVKAWSDREQRRLREEILVPVFGGNACVMHNSMLAWEQGKPWPCLMSRHGDYHKIGKRYEWKQSQVWKTADRLASHFAKHF